MTVHLLKGLSDAMPPDRRAALDPYQARAATAGDDPGLEWQRAYRCAKWADRVVALPAHHHLVADARRAVEAVREVEKTIGAELADLIERPFASGEGANLSLSWGGGKGYPVSPRLELEIEWVFEAVHIAEKVAAKAGWDAVPWPDLVEEMLAVQVSQPYSPA
jgi:hypothetical protein